MPVLIEGNAIERRPFCFASRIELVYAAVSIASRLVSVPRGPTVWITRADCVDHAVRLEPSESTWHRSCGHSFFTSRAPHTWRNLLDFASLCQQSWTSCLMNRTVNPIPAEHCLIGGVYYRITIERRQITDTKNQMFATQVDLDSVLCRPRWRENARRARRSKRGALRGRCDGCCRGRMRRN